MAGVAQFNRTELIVSSEQFYRLVHPLTNTEELNWYGLEPRGLFGDLGPSQLQALMTVVEQCPEFHIVSHCQNMRTLNRLVEDAAMFNLARGDNNPYIVFNPWLNPCAPLIDDDVFAKHGRELHEIYRRLKR